MPGKNVPNTEQCLSEFKCLTQSAAYPRCTVEYAFGKDLMFVSGPSDAHCPFRMRFGNGHICDCPTHYAIQTRPHQMVDDLPAECGEPPDCSWQPAQVGGEAPKTVSEAVAMLVKALSHQERAAIANMGTEDIGEATIALGDQIRQAFGLEADNRSLYRSCADETGCEIVHPDDAAAIILARLVQVLQDRVQ